MSERALLLDEMLSGAIAEQLRERGHDVSAVVDDSELVGTPDAELLEYATRDGRCLVTMNIADFALLSTQWSAEGRLHGGLLFIASRSFPQSRSFVGAVVRALRQMLDDDEVPVHGMEAFLSRS